MPDDLKKVFEACREVPEIRRMLVYPHEIITGPFKLLGKRATEVWKDVSDNGRIYRWDTAQGPQIHILPVYIANKLLEGSGFPYERDFFYHDRDLKRRMMSGEIARGIHRRDGVVAVMIRTDRSYDLLEKLETRTKAIETAIEAISRFEPGSKFVIEVTATGLRIENQPPRQPKAITPPPETPPPPQA